MCCICYIDLQRFFVTIGISARHERDMGRTRMSIDRQDDDRAQDRAQLNQNWSREPEALIRREIAEQQTGRKPAARSGGLKIAITDGRWRAVSRAIESQERALQGDRQLLEERLNAGCASSGEQKLAAGLLSRRVKPRKKKLSELLAEDRRQLAAEFVKERTKPGVKRDSVVAEAEAHFDIARSEVYASLKKARE
jgi:hypothetical protein